MPTALPALSLIAEPGRRRATLDIAREIERRGFAGISVSSRQHVAKRRPRVGDRAHSVRHRHSADLRAIGRRVRAKRCLSARGFRRAVSVRHRHRPRTGLCPHGGQARQAAWRHCSPQRYSQRRGDHLLNIGCGIGGQAQWIAAKYGCRVTGADLTAEFCGAYHGWLS